MYSSIWICTHRGTLWDTTSSLSPHRCWGQHPAPLTTSRAKLQRNDHMLFVLQVFCLKNQVSRYTCRQLLQELVHKSWRSCIRTAAVSWWLLEQEGRACRMITTGLLSEYQLQSLLLAVMTFNRIRWIRRKETQFVCSVPPLVTELSMQKIISWENRWQRLIMEDDFH